MNVLGVLVVLGVLGVSGVRAGVSTDWNRSPS